MKPTQYFKCKKMKNRVKALFQYQFLSRKEKKSKGTVNLTHKKRLRRYAIIRALLKLFFMKKFDFFARFELNFAFL